VRRPNKAAKAVCCPLCKAADQSLHKTVADVAYYECAVCDFIYVDPAVCARIDRGTPLVSYDRGYWQQELSAARERSRGSSLARAAEVILYCRIPIARFIDIGTGPGYLLDALSWILPESREKFYGVELFPPEPAERSTHPNYVVGTLGAAGLTFQSGCCIEVIEHLTPRMMRAFALELANCSDPGACYIFNTGLTDYVKHEDPNYIDPHRRGHISIWSVTAARRIFKAPKFKVHALPGKTWAFLVEVEQETGSNGGAINDRIWTPCEANARMLKDEQTGSLMYVLGIDTARAYLL
jgi:hypothetical protein